MIALPLPFGGDEGLGRLFSFGVLLALATGLALAKAATIAVDLRDRPSAAEPEPIGPPAESEAPPSLDLTEDGFIPWPTVPPEPAAGPSETEETEPAEAGPPVFDPSSLTEGQILALQQLAARRQELDERERLLDMRAELNGRATALLDQQISRLAELKASLEALLADLDEAEELKLARLVKIYETMKPKAAAEIFNRLDIPVLLHVVERMKEAKSAVVLGKMDPTIAKRVTTELARKKERPQLIGQDIGGQDVGG